jgi:hypothetical protein
VRGDVSHDRGCVGALGVQVGVGVVFGGTPQVVLRVLEQRPPLVLAQETGHPHDVVGAGRLVTRVFSGRGGRGAAPG